MLVWVEQDKSKPGLMKKEEATLCSVNNILTLLCVCRIILPSVYDKSFPPRSLFTDIKTSCFYFTIITFVTLRIYQRGFTNPFPSFPASIRHQFSISRITHFYERLLTKRDGFIGIAWVADQSEIQYSLLDLEHL